MSIILLFGLLYSVNLASYPKKQRFNVSIIPSLFFPPQGVGTVVSGTCMQGVIRLGDTLLLGPTGIGEFIPVAIRGIQRKRLPVQEVKGGQTASFALKKVTVVLISPTPHPHALSFVPCSPPSPCFSSLPSLPHPSSLFLPPTLIIPSSLPLFYFLLPPPSFLSLSPSIPFSLPSLLPILSDSL